MKNMMTTPLIGYIDDEKDGFFTLRAFRYYEGILYFSFAYVYKSREDAEKRAAKYKVQLKDPKEIESLKGAGGKFYNAGS